MEDVLAVASTHVFSRSNSAQTDDTLLLLSLLTLLAMLQDQTERHRREEEV